jgi:hypothetical protein
LRDLLERVRMPAGGHHHEAGRAAQSRKPTQPT